MKLIKSFFSAGFVAVFSFAMMRLSSAAAMDAFHWLKLMFLLKEQERLWNERQSEFSIQMSLTLMQIN